MAKVSAPVVIKEMENDSDVCFFVFCLFFDIFFPSLSPPPPPPPSLLHRRIANMRQAYRSLKHTYDREMSQWDRRIRDANNRTELFGGCEPSAETKSRANDLGNERDMLLKSLASGNQTAEWQGTLSSHIGVQGDRLKGVQRSLISMASTLGLSDSVIKMIGQREFMDRLLLFALMILTLIIFLLCYWYM